MNKTEMVKKYAETAGISEPEAKSRIEAIAKITGDALLNGEDVRFDDLGTFKTGYRPAGMARNLRDKTAPLIPVAESASLRFQISSNFKTTLQKPELIAAKKAKHKSKASN